MRRFSARGSKSRFLLRLSIFPLAFFYTCLVFFGLRVYVEKIHYHNFGPALYLFIVYVLGLADILFIANFIFTN